MKNVGNTMKNVGMYHPSCCGNNTIYNTGVGFITNKNEDMNGVNCGE